MARFICLLIASGATLGWFLPLWLNVILSTVVLTAACLYLKIGTGAYPGHDWDHELGSGLACYAAFLIPFWIAIALSP